MDIRPIRVSRLLLVVATASASTAFGQPIYTVTDLGTLGGSDSFALAVSDAAHVVGFADTGALDERGSPVRHAFLWRSGVMTDLGTLGGRESMAVSVNAAGEAVGWAEDAGSNMRTVVWQPADNDQWQAGINEIDAAGCDGEAHDINEAGQIVGWNDLGLFLWLPYGAYSLSAGLNLLYGDDECDGLVPFNYTAINNWGQVVTYEEYWLPEPAYGSSAGWHCFCCGCADDNVDLTDLNDHGLAVGWNSQLAASYTAAWDLGTRGVRHLGNGGSPAAINDGNEVVYMHRPYGTYTREPRWAQLRTDGTWRMARLQARIAPHSDISLLEPTGINEEGQIAGVGGATTGARRAVLLSPIDANLNGDRLIDSGDFLGLPACVIGPADEPPAACMDRDFDRNGRVDMLDVQLFQWAFGSQP